MILYLKNKKNLKIVTISLSVINEFINFFSNINHTHSIFLIGGEVKLNLLSTSGIKISLDINNYFFDKAFLTLDGLSLENIFLVTDENFNTSKFYKVCDLNQVNYLVSVNPENSFLKNLVKNFNINLY